MGSTGRVSVLDVARFAGVSQGTVSNVLNHPDRVSPARRQAVEDAIRTLGFVRHEAARHLRAGYSSTVGLLLLDWSPAFTDIARGVDDTTAARGLTVLISNSTRDTTREETSLRLFSEQRVAGLIVVPHDTLGEGLHRIRAGGIPVVIVDRAETGDQGLSVAVDDITGGELAARHIIGLGHRHIAFVGDEAAAVPVQDRLTGVLKAIAETGGDIRLDVLPADLTAEAGRETGEQLAAMPPGKRPTAVMTGVDLLAVGVLQALLQHGIRVPQDISLMGYDDIPFARQLSVPLTTVRRPHYDMGTTAAEMLVTALSGQAPQTRHVVFQPELVVRESTAERPTRPRGGRNP
ncbi:MAG: Transcriptional regulator, LacI family [Marmoricola sp.]|nr:Transcriptional regulator, LacI family [Marmoricola sp.]